MIAFGARRVYKSEAPHPKPQNRSLEPGKARHQVGPIFRRDSSSLASVKSSARRVNIEHSLFGQFGLGFHRVKSQKGSWHLKAMRCPVSASSLLCRKILKRRGAENAEEVSSEGTLRPLRLSVSNSYTACGGPDAYAFLVVAGFLGSLLTLWVTSVWQSH